MSGQDRCNSCGVVLLGRGSATFLCPSCGEAPIGRCPRCRDQSVTYVCAQCDFHGP